jgi:HEAT repeat protein
MRTTVFIASVVLCSATWLPLFAQTSGDKAKDDKKEPEKITADTKIGGKNLDQWIELIKGKDRSVSEIAIKNVLAYPPDAAMRAVPTLIGEIKKHNAPAPVDLSVRVNACVALGQILGSAKDPHKDPSDPKRDLVKDAVEQLNRMLKDDQIIVRYRAAQAAGMMGPMAHDTIPNLITNCANTTTWEVREAATIALGGCAWEKEKEPATGVLPALYANLGKDEYTVKVRLAALRALGNLAPNRFKKTEDGYKSKLESVATLDTDPMVKLRATFLVWPLLTEKDASPFMGSRKKHFEIVAKLADNPEPEIKLELIRVMAALALKDTKDKKAVPHKEMVDVIYKLLDDDSVAIKGEAIAALKHLRQADLDADRFIGRVEKIATSSKEEIPLRFDAFRTLFEVGKAADKKRLGLEVAELLTHKEPTVRVEVCKLIADEREDAATSVKGLIKAMDDKDEDVQHWAIFALAHIGKAAEEARPKLKKIANDPLVAATVRETAQNAIDVLDGKIKLPPKEEPKKDETKKGSEK